MAPKDKKLLMKYTPAGVECFPSGLLSPDELEKRNEEIKTRFIEFFGA